MIYLLLLTLAGDDACSGSDPAASAALRRGRSALSKRNRAPSRYSATGSKPIHLPFRRSVASLVVQLPANGSRTGSPSPVRNLMKNSGSSTGKRAGWGLIFSSRRGDSGAGEILGTNRDPVKAWTEQAAIHGKTRRCLLTCGSSFLCEGTAHPLRFTANCKSAAQMGQFQGSSANNEPLANEESNSPSTPSFRGAVAAIATRNQYSSLSSSKSCSLSLTAVTFSPPIALYAASIWSIVVSLFISYSICVVIPIKACLECRRLKRGTPAVGQ